MNAARIVRPADCALLIGIPTTAAAFTDAVADKRAGRRDFACAARFGGLAGYRTEVIEPFDRARRQWGRCGVEVVEQATSAALQEHLRCKSDGVTIVFTHFLGDSIELFDGLLDCDAFAGNVPADHRGVIDLCMCKPMPLVNSIKRTAPRSDVCFASAALTPALWFLFYVQLFRLLETEDISYIDAMERTCVALARRGAAS